ncbi:zinc finger protein 2-like [Rhopalosiphum padi]|uniref:zinc finger protein 2-like n=1 Tax=Rhopalosiphum padi TaxID=40932 RepID=UPI00298DA569|nr:zinc finger protein 2-like [Rhopalosiphum padi]
MYVCSNIFYFIINYSLSFIGIAQLQNGRWICPNSYCGRTYKKKFSLYRHCRQECGVEPQYQCLYFCPISGRYICPNTCGRSYKERHNLIRHLRKECGVAPQHKCIQCSKAFKHKAHLTRHLLSCSNIPPSFECIFCGRMFRCRDTLKKHNILVHNNLLE